MEGINQAEVAKTPVSAKAKSENNRREAARRAREKIFAIIEYVFENFVIGREIKKIREKFCIPDNFFNEYKIPIIIPPVRFPLPPKILNIDTLLIRSIVEWGDKILSNEKTLDQVIRNLGKRKFELLAKKVTNRKIKKEARRNYALSVLGNFFWDKDKADLYKPMRINPGVWGSIVMAKVFEIPQKIVYACINSILDKYFPTVDNKMRIQFNELTSIGDIKYIWAEVEKQQRGFIEDHRINIQKKYLNHDRDKKAYELYQKNPSLSNEEIMSELSKNDKNKKFNLKFEPATIPVIIRTYKKFINQ